MPKVSHTTCFSPSYITSSSLIKNMACLPNSKFWMSSHSPLKVFGAGLDHDNAKGIASRLFDIMERHLDGRDWLVGRQPTIADIANYTYIQQAPEGDVSLAEYPNILNWLSNIQSLDGFVPMQSTKVGLAA